MVSQLHGELPVKQVNTEDTADGEEPEWKSRPDKFPLEEIDANAAIETGLLHSYRVPPENPTSFCPCEHRGRGNVLRQHKPAGFCLFLV